MAISMEFLYGSATGVGSLPHRDVSAALRLVKENLPRGPHWPQLPNIGSDGGFIRQYLSFLIDLNIIALKKGETPFFSNGDEVWPEKEQGFYELYLEMQESEEKESRVLDLFAFPHHEAKGFYSFLEEDWSTAAGEKPDFVKGHITGPLSLGLQVTSADGKAAFYPDNLRDILVKNLVLHGRSQVRALKKTGAPVVIFIDEPALLAYGQSMYASLAAGDIMASLEEIILALREEGAIVGVHCCAGIDWSLLFNLPLDIVSFDAYSYFDSLLVYAEDADSFLKRGGILAWGLVPTAGAAIDTEEISSLEKRFEEGIERLVKKGLSPQRLRKQYMLTPSCGTATLTIEQAEKVYRLTADLKTAISL